MALLLIVPMTVYMFIRPCELLLFGIGRHRLIGWVSLAEAALVLLLSYAVVPTFGLLGMAVLVGCSMLLIRPLVTPAFACRQVGLSQALYWRQGPLRALLVCLVAAPPSGLVFHLWQVGSWPQLFLAFAVYSVVWGLSAALLASTARSEPFGVINWPG